MNRENKWRNCSISKNGGKNRRKTRKRMKTMSNLKKLLESRKLMEILLNLKKGWEKSLDPKKQIRILLN